jgi:hypothetical protein
MDTQVAVKQDVHFTSYADDWNGRTKCNEPVLGGAVVVTNWAAVTCPKCKQD